MVSGPDLGIVAKLAASITRSCAVTIAAGVVALVFPGLAIAAPAPAWSIAISSYPTQFAAVTGGGEGTPPGYLVLVTNYGAAATSGKFTITDRLSARLAFSTAAGASGTFGGRRAQLDCEVSGQTVSCSGNDPLQPGETARMTVPVKVKPESSGAVLDRATISGGGAVGVEARTATQIGDGSPAFELLPGADQLSGAISGSDGSTATLAGSHPYQFRASLSFPTELAAGSLLAAGGGVRDLEFDLPPGMVVDRTVVPEPCNEPELISNACPDSAQVGTVALAVDLFGNLSVETVALYVMVPPPGVPVEFGLEGPGGVALHLLGRLSSEGGYRLTAGIHDILAVYPVLGAEVSLWGEPTDGSHDYVRGACLQTGAACPVERTHKAFLTLPGNCRQPLTGAARADSWDEPGVFATRSIESPAAEGCNALAFDPTLLARPTTNVTDSPTGFEVDFHLPQSNGFEGRAEANLKDARVALPEGLAINPSGASGLGACSPGELALATCPENAEIGTAEVDTPILGAPLTGAVYLATPGENPFGSLLALYVVIDDPATGVVVKLPARLDADPRTGRLTLSLEELPQLPLEDIKLTLFKGPRALLKTPIGCGTHTTTADLTPWSSPEGANAKRADSFATSAAPGGGACPSGEADAPAAANYFATGAVAAAGAYDPFTLRVSRDDGSQRLSAIDGTLPAGLSAKLAGVSSCSDVEIAADECPAASQVGTVSLTAGAGPNPLALTGRAYLAGPYKGALLSLAVVVPVVAGPFDLGTVTVRAALYVDSASARVHAVSDPLPTILDGIPLDIRELRLELDRPDFVRNPTSCEPMSADGTLTTAAAQTVSLHNHFQVRGCGALGFRPRLRLRLAGPGRRGAHPSLSAVLRPRPGDANLRGATVTLPAGELLDSRHIRGICSRERYASRSCPPGSIYGEAEVWSPLLDRPLSGPIHLRSSSRRLPDLAASLDGQVHIDLTGHLESRHGRIRVAFGSLPDVPLTKVSLQLAGGRRGLLVNSGGLCRGRRRAQVSMSAQSGKIMTLDPPVETRCGGPSEAVSEPFGW